MTSSAALATYYLHLAWLLDSGLPPRACLVILAQDASSPGVRQKNAQAGGHLEPGTPLTRALALAGLVPRPFYGLLWAAEASGHLTAALQHLGQVLEHWAERRRRLSTHLTRPLPAAVATLALAILALGHILPTLDRAFSASRLPRPPLVRSLLAIGAGAGQHLPTLLAAGALALGLLLLAALDPDGQTALDHTLLELPWVGPTVLLSNLALYALALSWLLDSGLPILRALHVATMSPRNRWLAQRLHLARRHVAQGQVPIAEALRQTHVLPRFALDLVRAGEQTGRLPHSLARAAEQAERLVDRRLTAAATLLEPALWLLLGSLVALLGVAIYSPALGVIRALGTR